MKICTYCGKSYPDKATTCVVDMMPLKSDVTIPPSNEEENETVALASFDCATCDAVLRFRLSESEALFRCPKCRTAYRSRMVGDSPPVFLLIADSTTLNARRSRSSRSMHREVSPRVKSALIALGLDESATFDEIRQTYRDLVKSYHPDKVASLGSELRQVAEKKTKELNSAYEVLQEFHAA